ncbi:MAG: FecR family protein [Deltaproteobacteria bacterium]|nr:FecR family protein [Deltaproteobacteria bacterium]
MHRDNGRSLFSLWLIFLFFFMVPDDGLGLEKKEGRSGKDQAQVTLIQGKAEVLKKGEGQWNPLKVGSLLVREDEIRTGEKSRIEIQLPDRSILRFDQKATFKMKAVSFDAQDGSREVRVDMGAGKTWANVRKAFGPKKTFEIASANAVAGVRDTIWRLSVAEDQSTMIRVYEGTVEIYNPFVKPDYKPEEGGFRKPREVKGPQEVPAPFREVTQGEWEQIVLTQMMQVLVPAVGKPEKPVSFSQEEDDQEEWVRWNKKRDQGIK